MELGNHRLQCAIRELANVVYKKTAVVNVIRVKAHAEQPALIHHVDFGADVEEWHREQGAILHDQNRAALLHDEKSAAAVTRLL